MSELLAMLMRKKQEIMYATIKGTLTENDGVFSGFSASNYLDLQQPFKLNADTVAEFLFKINLSSVGVVNGIMATPDSYGISFITGSNNLLRLYMGNGSSWTLLDKTGVTTVSANTDYYIKLTINKGNILCALSTDKVNWITQFTDTITIIEEYIYNLSCGLGRVSSTQYLRGSIDLNQSYIKLGSTKYKLQAVVGYTIVGSPTITDGVVSGFSSSNYLTIPAPTEVIDSFEYIMKIITPNSLPSTWLALMGQQNVNYSTPQIEYLTNGNIDIRTSTNGSSWDSSNIVEIPTSLNTTYWIKFIYKNGIIESLLSTDGINYTSYGTKETSAIYWSGIASIGNDQSLHIYTGSIAIVDTKIKINNKLWFNGQPA